MIRSLALIAFSSCILIYGCSSEPKKESGDSAPPTQSTTAAQPESQPTASAAAYATVQNIFNTKCIACHGENGKEGIDLRTYESVMKGGRDGAIVKPGDGANSEIVKVLQPDSHERMPKGQPPLPDSEISAITAWINAGATKS